MATVAKVAKNAKRAKKVVAIAGEVRDLMSPPSKYLTYANGYFALIWSEIRPDGKAHVMVWSPENEEELAEATRFYEDARNLKGVNIPLDAPIANRSPEEQKLIEAVLDDIEAPAPRLAYARFLEKQGDSRGEFFRLTTYLKTIPTTSREFRPLEDHWLKLHEKYKDEWVAPLDEFGLVESDTALFIQITGMIEELNIQQPGILPERARHLFAAVPLLNGITLQYQGMDAPGISLCPELSHITRLTIYAEGGVPIPNLEALICSKYLTRLRKLTLVGYSFFGDKLADILAAAPYLQKLRQLNLASCQVKPSLLKVLRNCPDLVSLDLGSGEWLKTCVTARDLAKCDFIPNLRELSLSWSYFNHGPANAILHLPFQSLETLSMESNPFGDEGAKRLATHPGFAKLRKLKITGCDISDEGLLAIIHSPHLTQLNELSIEHNRITGAALKKLVTSPKMQTVEYLNMNGMVFDDQTAIALAESKHVDNLRYFAFDDDCLTEKGQRALKKRWGDGFYATHAGDYEKHVPISYPTTDPLGRAWERVRSWLPVRLSVGNDPADIKKVEEAIGYKFPAEIFESLARYNGEIENDTRFFRRLYMMQLADALDAWCDLTEGGLEPDPNRLKYQSTPTGAIQLEFHHKGWFPLIADEDRENFIGVDLAPGPRGIVGQIITFGYFRVSKHVLAPGWSEFLLRLTQSIEDDDLDAVTPGKTHPIDFLEKWVSSPM